MVVPNSLDCRRLFALAAMLVSAGCDTYELVECTNDTPAANGLATCEQGYVHRPSAFTCDKMGPATDLNSCLSDEHCEGVTPMYCYCGDEGGFCMPTDCRSDADCEAPYVCAEMADSLMLACQTADDECMVRDDCGEDEFCVWDGTRRACQEFSGGCGSGCNGGGEAPPPAPGGPR
jgi:hypothetical protein